jgi:hypothetical protein
MPPEEQGQTGAPRHLMSNRYVSHFCTDSFEKRFDAARHGEADMGPDITPRAALADKVTNADKF